TTSELATRADREAYFVAAKRYIDAHLADPQLGVLGIAGALGCSRATLYRAFSERDVSLANYIKEARLSRAAQLLRKGAAPETLSKLAHDCGFTNADHFRREFRRRFGLSPSEFRMLHAAGPTPLWETVDLY